MKLSSLRNAFGIFLLTVLAVLIHGYHPGAEDSETYLPGVEKVLHPKFFPIGQEYFQLHAHLTFFPQLIALSVRTLHLPLAWTLFLWHLATIFLFLLACRVLAGSLFKDARAIWGGVALMTALLTLPVAGTALYIMDQYVNPRNMTAFAVIFAVTYVLKRKYWAAAPFLVYAIAIHPFMSSFTVFYCLLLSCIRIMENRKVRDLSTANVPALTAGWAWPQEILSAPKSYHKAATSHSYQYFLQWRWYEILGGVAPLGILYWFGALARQKRLRNMEIVCRSLIVYGAFYLALGVLFSSSEKFESLARLQPMRGFYLIYVFMILIGGGFLAEHVLKNRPLRWLALFLPLCAGMCYAQLRLFPASAHVEFPGATPRNPWVQSFDWIRQNTPDDAIIAIDPNYMNIPGEDANGLRAIAERSQLADAGKDAGVVEMFPQIADGWLKQVRAQQHLNRFTQQDFARLRAEYGVGWVVLQQPASPALDCPYSNKAVKVCRLY